MPVAITVQDRSFLVEPDRHLRFWTRVSRGEWERETFQIFDRFIGPDTLYIDVGAWIGSTALYAAQAAQRCIAFEPDPVAFAELSRNLEANAQADWAGRVQINNCAVNADGKPFVLGGSRDGADSMSSALFPDNESQWTVDAVRLADVLAAHRAPGQPVFLKIDIEGGEYALLPTLHDLLRDPLVTAFISFHPLVLLKALQRNQVSGDWLESHLAVTRALPDDRRIEKLNGRELRRDALENWVRKQLRFPEELLICSP